ncbi:unnamed protein product [Cylicocyclus nassatus]|uniref:G-protein coupled receptors family 1 profile domain-containing protein n=1 Tax=Cylicocyclus nassatus TaxID=53992 RepID=A0AA36GRX1_CYLNA|nr:unnamed protein product [Cylicocyclus nassatus]
MPSTLPRFKYSILTDDVWYGMLNERNASSTVVANNWHEHQTAAAAAAAAGAAVNGAISPTIADESLGPFMESVTLAGILLLLILFCVIGNLFVLVAIAWERDLRGRPQYYLIFSLAVADLVVGLIVTPLGAYSTVAGEWRFGITLCDIWISVDVIVCTASILHLVAIALDRYWSVTDISYVQNRTPKRIVIMLAIIWMTSVVISLAPFAGWKDEGFKDRVLRQHVCLISQRISYQVFSTATAFYIPLIAIICIYWKIMRAAKKRFKRERDRRTIIRQPEEQQNEKSAPLILKKNKKPSSKALQIPSPPTMVTNVEKSEDFRNKKGITADSSTSTQSEEGNANHNVPEQETKLDDMVQKGNGKKKHPVKTVIIKKKRRKENAETKRERKAWRTLAIITGTFVACWTPFFLVSLYRPICGCTIPRLLETVTSWLGYLNSALNPIIYTVFSQDMRAAFKKILKKICLLKEN